MSEQQNLDIVRRGYEAFGRGDLDALLELCDDDVEWITPGPSDLPSAGHRHGRQQVREFFNAVFATWDIQTFVPETFVAQGDRVVVLGSDTAVVRATGKTIVEPWAHAFLLKNGKIAGFQEYLDTHSTVAELHSAQTKA